MYSLLKVSLYEIQKVRQTEITTLYKYEHGMD